MVKFYTFFVSVRYSKNTVHAESRRSFFSAAAAWQKNRRWRRSAAACTTDVSDRRNLLSNAHVQKIRLEFNNFATLNCILKLERSIQSKEVVSVDKICIENMQWTELGTLHCMFSVSTKFLC